MARKAVSPRKDAPAHSLVTLREVMGLQASELGKELFGISSPVQASKKFIACQKGRSSLRRDGIALWNAVDQFGIHPESILPSYPDQLPPITLLDLRSEPFSALWFLAWIFTSDDDPPPMTSTDAEEKKFLAFGRRIDRADNLCRLFKESYDQFGTLLPSYDACSTGDASWLDGLYVWVDEPDKKRPLFDLRKKLAKRIFVLIAAEHPWDCVQRIVVTLENGGLMEPNPKNQPMWEHFWLEQRYHVSAVLRFISSAEVP